MNKLHFAYPVCLTDGGNGQVRITCRDGRMLDSGDVLYARGNALNPMAPDELRQKFLDCVAHGGGTLDAEALYRRLAAFESLDDVRALFG